MINYEEFSRVQLKVGKVLEAEKVENSEKLIKLQVDLGDEKRQIVAGIGKTYQAETLIGKQIVVVANLEPRTLMGLESNGMLLAAHDESGPIVITLDKDVNPGADIQ